MPALRIQATGVREVARYFTLQEDGITKNVPEQIASAFKAANQLETPKRTGRLRRSFRVQVRRPANVRLQWLAPYASYVNDRPSKTGSQGFANRVVGRAQLIMRNDIRHIVNTARRNVSASPDVGELTISRGRVALTARLASAIRNRLQR